jgi:hypothetical protein
MSQMNDNKADSAKRLLLLRARFNSYLLQKARLREQLEALLATMRAPVKLDGDEDANPPDRS